MSHKLAIICPRLGAPSETFIRRHIQNLYPGKTVVVAERSLKEGERTWSTESPIYEIDTDNFMHKSFCSLGRLFEQESFLKMGLIGAGRFLRQHNVDIVLGEFLDVSWPFRKLLKDLNIRFFPHAFGCDLSSLFRYQKWRKRYASFADVDGLIVINKIMRQRLLSVGIPEHKIHHVPPGIDVPDFVTRHMRRGGLVRCLAVGRMVAKKAPLVLLEAFRTAVSSGSPLHLDYVGTGPFLEQVHNYIRVHDLENNLTLHGTCGHHRVMELMQQADIFLQHSVTDLVTGDEEGLPVAILDAMAAGLPVISTRHSGIPEAVVEGVTGLLVNEGEGRAMSRHIVALAQNEDLRLSMGRCGWERARHNFSWEREKDALLSVLGLKS